MLKRLLNKLRSSNGRGFTLIEVVIVLAIAGLIFVIVFLAVSAAQASRRDNERRQGAGRLISGAESYAGNNNGNLPAGCANFATYYALGNLTCADGAAAGATSGAPNALVYFDNDGNCEVAGTSTGKASVSYWSEKANAAVCQGD